MIDFDRETLRAARKLAGLTLAEMAERAELHPTTLLRLEQGIIPSEALWNRILVALKKALAERERECARMRKKIAT